MTATVTKLLTGDFYKTLLDSIFDAVYMVDVHGTILYWNESCSRITGYTAKEMMGLNFVDTPFAGMEDKSAISAREKTHGISIVLETGMPGTWKGYVCRKNGQRIPVESHISAILNDKGQITGAIEVFRDISAHVSLEDSHRQLLQMSRKDQLTGLFNRSATSDLLKAEIERSRRYKQFLSVVMIDIDHFKRVNDRYGHDAGDKVLAKIGSVLAHNLRQPDAVGRWGGEEFLVIVPNNGSEAAAHLAERIRGFIKKNSIEEVPGPITASFGVAQLRPEQGPDQLLYQADMALYQAKRDGRDRVVIASDDLETPVEE